METTRLVLGDLAAAEIEPDVLAVKQHAGRLQAPHRLAHPVMPDLLSLFIPRHADGGRRHGRVFRDALEAEPVAARLRP